ncbi:PA2779 family protein [Lentisalinibacter sediminis]|uniref:PA2779 family protein n=1 Tax=Lentisalinibacter sediminis TaxID=2992237 RepID=UPI003869EBC9
MTSSVFCRFVTGIVAAALLSSGFSVSASAGVISTEQAATVAERMERLDRVSSFLARQDVAAELERFGVDPALAAERAAALSDAELAELDGRIADAAAGGDLLAVIGIVFVVLLILELVGVTNVFSRI